MTMTAADESGTEFADPSIRPQDDLFRHVNGRWLRESVIPDDRSVDGAFYALRDEAEAASRELVESLEQPDGTEPPPPGSPAQLIGDLYGSFMDVDAVERLGTTPIADQLAEVDGVADVEALVALQARLRRSGVGGAWVLDIDTDPEQPDRYVLNLWQGGLGLPDESYYREEQYAEIRASYVRHIERLLALAGLDDAAARAARVLALETDLAAEHWDRVRSRDDSETTNPMDRPTLDTLLPPPLWDRWQGGLQAPPATLQRVIVRQPSYFFGLAGLLTDERLEAWRDHLRWNVVRAAAPLGPAALVEEHFDFYGRTLSGTPELRERWKRGVGLVERSVGEALGQLYVERHFPAAAKQRMQELVANLLEAYRASITALPWMSEATKARALDKLDQFTPKIGYPERWRDYGALEIRRDDLLGNGSRATAYELDRQLAKLGQPVDRDEWFMTPQTVNAYYNPGMNEIVFPAAILRPPFFDPEASDAVNYGGIGAVIGHEIGHGFDDQGSKYDGRGAMDDWWTEQDRAAFDALTARLVAQYAALEPAQTPGHQVNGALTVGENIGDLGGLGIAYKAWRLARGSDDAEPDPDGTRELFTSWATVWRSKSRDAEVLRHLAIDPHSPPEFRCNQVVRNLDEFHQAFEVQPGDALWLEEGERVRIW